MIVNVPLFAWNSMAPLSWILRRASFAARGCLVEHRVEPWPSLWPSKIAKFLADCPMVYPMVIYGEKIGKYGLGPGKRSSFCQILNPDKMFPFCMLYSDCQQDYLLRSWKNSRWTNKTWSESFSNEHRIPDCFNMFQQTSTTYKMFSQHVGGRSLINMVSWHREIASWNPHKETSAVTGWRKKLEKMPSCRLFNN